MLAKGEERDSGNFGTLSSQYQSGRRGFPKQVIEYIFARIHAPSPRVLDVACGTGIGTRQLYEGGALVDGTDISPEMIVQAELENDHCIDYHIASAESQPYSQKSFDAVTVFSAFHWFSCKEVLEEFTRVLKPGGILFIINKRDTGNFKAGFRAILANLGVKRIPDAKVGYDPKTLLSAQGFNSIQIERFYGVERFSRKAASNFFQSTSLWNLVSENRKADALTLLEAYFTQHEQNGVFLRDLEITVISGVSPMSGNLTTGPALTPAFLS